MLFRSLVIGAENRGVSAEILALADQRIEIPSDGMGGSINLTTAAAIVLYELSRRFPLGASRFANRPGPPPG